MLFRSAFRFWFQIMLQIILASLVPCLSTGPYQIRIRARRRCMGITEGAKIITSRCYFFLTKFEFKHTPQQPVIHPDKTSITHPLNLGERSCARRFSPRRLSASICRDSRLTGRFLTPAIWRHGAHIFSVYCKICIPYPRLQS